MKNRDKVKCFTCNKIGHFASKCPNKVSNHGKKPGNSIISCTANRNDRDLTWIADSGASHHMTFCKDWFKDYEDYPKPLNVTVGNNASIEALGEDTLSVEIMIGRKKSMKTIEKVWYVPELGKNLLSVRLRQTVSKGYVFKAYSDKCVFLQSGKPILFGRIRNGLYELNMKVLSSVHKNMAHNINIQDTESQKEVENVISLGPIRFVEDEGDERALNDIHEEALNDIGDEGDDESD